MKSEPFILVVSFEESLLEIHCQYSIEPSELTITSGHPVFLEIFFQQTVRINMDALCLVDNQGKMQPAGYWQQQLIAAVKKDFQLTFEAKEL